MGLQGTSAWLRDNTGITNETVYRDIELCAARDKKNIQQFGRTQTYTPPARENGLLYGLGKGHTEGSVYVCGNVLEIWVSVFPIARGDGIEGAKGEREGKTPESQKSVARRVNMRARKNIRRIINANKFQAMHTLTLAPPGKHNDRLYDTVTYEQQRDYDFCRDLLKKGLKRVSRKLGYNMQYVAVFEMHNSKKTSPEKKGCWHMHLATAVSDAQKNAVASCWKYGMVDYQDFRKDKEGNERDEIISNPGAYMSEYIGKNGSQFGKRDLNRKRRYTTSRGIKRPLQLALEGACLEGDFERIRFRGADYQNTYYTSKHIPGTQLMSINATYILTGGQTND